MYGSRPRYRADNHQGDIEADRDFLTWLKTATQEQILAASKRCKKWPEWRRVALARALRRRAA